MSRALSPTVFAEVIDDACCCQISPCRKNLNRDTMSNQQDLLFDCVDGVKSTAVAVHNPIVFYALAN